MSIRTAFTRTAVTLTTAPELLGVTLILALLKLAGSVLALTHPLLYLPGLLLSLFGSPYLIAGLYGLIVAALHDDPLTTTTFIETANNQYLRLFVGRAAVGLFELGVVGLALAAVTLVGQPAVSVPPIATPSTAALYTVPIELLTRRTIVMGGLLIIALLPLFFLQFFGLYVVIESAPLFDAYDRSARLVHESVWAVGKYTLVRSALVGSLVGPAGVFRSVATVAILTNSLGPVDVPQAVPLPMMSGITVGVILGMALVLSMVGEAVSQTFHAAYFTQLTEW